MCVWKALLDCPFRQREQSAPRSLISHPASALLRIRSGNPEENDRAHDILQLAEATQLDLALDPSASCGIAKVLGAGGRNGYRLSLQAANEEFAFVDEFLRKMIVQVEEKLLMPNNLPAPGGAVQALEFLEFLLGKIQSIPVDVFVARLPPDGGLLAEGTAASTLHDPLEHPHVFPETGPEKFAILPLSEPVDMENARRLAQ